MFGNGFSESCPVGAWMRYQFQVRFCFILCPDCISFIYLFILNVL